ECGGTGQFRVPRRSLQRRLRPQERGCRDLHRGLRGAGGVARPLRAAASLCGGHVPARPLRTHRHRHARGRGRALTRWPRWRGVANPSPGGEGWSLWRPKRDASGAAMVGRRRRRIALTATGAGLLSLVAFGGWVFWLGPPPNGEAIEYSTLVLDREGRLLRPYPTVEGRWRIPASVDSVDPRFFALLFAYEDKRFRSHFGVDPGALVRAAIQLVANRRIVSGGSTLTMQVARLLEPRTE